LAWERALASSNARLNKNQTGTTSTHPGHDLAEAVVGFNQELRNRWREGTGQLNNPEVSGRLGSQPDNLRPGL
jgi:hypothetical protein